MSHRRKNLCLIYTGGTIGSAPGIDGALSPQSSGKYLLDKLDEERAREKLPPVRKVFGDVQIVDLFQYDSVDINRPQRMSFLQEASKWIQEGYSVIGAHGTDTMEVTGSFLAFHYPFHTGSITLVGSRKTPFEPDTDAFNNMNGAIQATAADLHGNFVSFDKDLLWAPRAVKIGGESQKEYFKSPHFGPVASVEDGALQLTSLGRDVQERYKDRLDLVLPVIGEKPMIIEYPERTLGLVDAWKLYADFDTRDLQEFASRRQIMVIETLGTGGIPETSRGVKVLPIIQEFIDQGKIIIATSRMPEAEVDLDRYVANRRLSHAGVIRYHNPDAAIQKGRSTAGFTSTKAGTDVVLDMDAARKIMGIDVVVEWPKEDEYVAHMLREFREDRIRPEKLIHEFAGMLGNYHWTQDTMYADDKTRVFLSDKRFGERMLAVRGLLPGVEQMIEERRLPPRELEALADLFRRLVESYPAEDPPADAPAVLITDNDLNVASAMKVAFRKKGFSVYTAHNTARALEVYNSTEKIDYSFTEVFLGAESGTALVDKMKQAGKPTEFFLTTSMPNWSENFRYDGITVLPKTPELLKLPERLLEIRAQRTEAETEKK